MITKFNLSFLTLIHWKLEKHEQKCFFNFKHNSSVRKKDFSFVTFLKKYEYHLEFKIIIIIMNLTLTNSQNIRQPFSKKEGNNLFST